jgi:hypothetical protein
MAGMKDRPEWLRKKIRKAQRAKAKRDPEQAKREADIRRKNWQLTHEFRAITK